MNRLVVRKKDEKIFESADKGKKKKELKRRMGIVSIARHSPLSRLILLGIFPSSASGAQAPEANFSGVAPLKRGLTGRGGFLVRIGVPPTTPVIGDQFPVFETFPTQSQGRHEHLR